MQVSCQRSAGSSFFWTTSCHQSWGRRYPKGTALHAFSSFEAWTM